MRTVRWLVVLLVAVGLAAAFIPGMLVASDHDDGETDTKGRNVNITDVYAFRECDQNAGASCGNLIFIMNVNPRSVARQQYYFSTNARYEIKIERPAGLNDEPSAVGLATPDAALRFTFGAPDGDRRQAITLTPVINGAAGAAVAAGMTTALNDSPIVTNVSVGGSMLGVFAGLRQDPFFFDVEQFFRVRAGVLGVGPTTVFRHPGIDFTWGYNVLSIVVRVPVTYLRQGGAATAFDVWTTVSVPDGSGGWTQVERLAQPAINEGLLVTNDYLNTLNAIGPDVEATLVEPANCAGALSNPIIGEAANTLLSLGNTVPQALAICNAFLPDVMRIEVSGPSGYAAAATTSGRPMRGRKITDDVIDITLGVIVPDTNQLLEHDNVAYDSNPPINATGHRPLLPGFPYLPRPN
jgi:hypothetical protein